jgi:hypothetical protein
MQQQRYVDERSRGGGQAPDPRRAASKNSNGGRINYFFVPFPQEIWNGGCRTSPGELFLLGYLLIHQLIERNNTLVFCDDELLNGRCARDGTRLDSGCCLKSRNGLKAARSRLAAKGWIRISDVRNGKRYQITLPFGPLQEDQRNRTAREDIPASKIDTNDFLRKFSELTNSKGIEQFYKSGRS